MNTKDYIDLRIEQLRLKGADGASRTLGSFLSWILIAGVLILLLMVLAFGGVLLIGNALDNYALGAFIVGGGLLVILIVLWCCRKVMFRGIFVRMLSDQRSYKDLVRKEEITDIRVSDADSNAVGLYGMAVRTNRILSLIKERRKA